MPEITLNIKLINEKKLSLLIDPATFVSNLKANVEQLFQVPVSQQKLVFRGRILKNDQTISSYEIQNDSVIVLLKVKPPSPADASASIAASQMTSQQFPPNPFQQQQNHPAMNAFQQGQQGFPAGAGGAPNANQIAQLLSNPQFVNMIAGNNPEMRQTLQDPQARQQLAAMLQANPQLLQGMSGQQAPTMPLRPQQPPVQPQAMPPRPPAAAAATNPFAAFNFAPTAFGNNTAQSQTPSPQTQPPMQVPMQPQGQAPQPTSNTNNTATNEDTLRQFLTNPLAAQAMAQQFGNPQMVERMAQQDPRLRQMLQIPGMQQMMQNPAFLQQMLSNQSNTNPMMNTAPQQQQQQQSMQQPMQQASPSIEALRARWGNEIGQLQEMGFYDEQTNIQALMNTGGNVEAAIEYILSHF